MHTHLPHHILNPQVPAGPAPEAAPIEPLPDATRRALVKAGLEAPFEQGQPEADHGHA